MQPTPPPERLLATTARSTFESLALLYAEPARGGAPDGPLGLRLGAGAVAAGVAFAGVARGEAVEGLLTVALAPAVAAAVAENMLGAAPGGGPGGGRDDYVRDDYVRDAVGELANVVCGHVLSAAGGPAAVFRLTAPGPAPVPHAMPTAAPGAAWGAWRAWLDVEGGPACVTLEAPAALFAGPSAAPGAGGAAG